VVGNHLDSADTLETFLELKDLFTTRYRPWFELDYLTVLIDRKVGYPAGESPGAQTKKSGMSGSPAID
jgi:hypothetical protein